MHVRQTELNIELFHETTAHRPEDAIIIYGLAEDYGRLALHRVERRPAVFIEMLGKAAAAFDADSAAAVTAEGVVTKQCVICPYRSRCAAAQARAIPAAGTGGLDQATLRSIDRLIAARQRAVEAEEEAARARAEVEAEIIATLTDGGASKIKRNGYAVRLKTTFGRPRRPRNPLRLKRRSALGPQVRSPPRALPDIVNSKRRRRAQCIYLL